MVFKMLTMKQYNLKNLVSHFITLNWARIILETSSCGKAQE